MTLQDEKKLMETAETVVPVGKCTFCERENRKLPVSMSIENGDDLLFCSDICKDMLINLMKD